MTRGEKGLARNQPVNFVTRLGDWAGKSIIIAEITLMMPIAIILFNLFCSSGCASGYACLRMEKPLKTATRARGSKGWVNRTRN